MLIMIKSPNLKIEVEFLYEHVEMKNFKRI